MTKGISELHQNCFPYIHYNILEHNFAPCVKVAITLLKDLKWVLAIRRLVTASDVKKELAFYNTAGNFIFKFKLDIYVILQYKPSVEPTNIQYMLLYCINVQWHLLGTSSVHPHHFSLFETYATVQYLYTPLQRT
jgi:hypothetical protein